MKSQKILGLPGKGAQKDPPSVTAGLLRGPDLLFDDGMGLENGAVVAADELDGVAHGEAVVEAQTAARPVDGGVDKVGSLEDIHLERGGGAVGVGQVRNVQLPRHNGVGVDGAPPPPTHM